MRTPIAPAPSTRIRILTALAAALLVLAAPSSLSADVEVHDGYGLSLEKGEQVMGYESDLRLERGTLLGRGGTQLVLVPAGAAASPAAPAEGYTNSAAAQAGTVCAVRTANGKYYRLEVISASPVGISVKLAPLTAPKTKPAGATPAAGPPGAGEEPPPPTPATGPAAVPSAAAPALAADTLQALRERVRRGLALAEQGNAAAAVAEFQAAIDVIASARPEAAPKQAPAARPPADVAAASGCYCNLSFNVDGLGGRNTAMPQLYLMPDGSYAWGSDAGRYEVKDGKLLLAGSYREWGPGALDTDRRIMFRFQKGGKEFVCTMSYRGSVTDYPPPGK